MRLADLVATTRTVAATSARTEKAEALAARLRGADPAEAGIVARIVAGDPRQGRIGVGWATVGGLDVEPAAAASLTVAELDALFDEIAATTGDGSAARRTALLGAFLARATEPEADFVRRLLIGELRQGANTGVVVDAVARAADVPATAVRRALMLSGDLATTTETALRHGRPGLDAVGLEMFRPIQPMLASSAESVAAAIDDLGEASVEWKLDGARIQVHRRGGDVRIWTRNLNDITDRLPEVVEIVQAMPADALALDGEVVGLGGNLEPEAFQDTMSRFGTDDVAATSVQLTPMFFDVMHRDGEDLLDTPLAERLLHLEAATGAHRIPGIVTADPDAAAVVFDEAIERGHEGAMVKAAGSSYQAGRRGKAWRKVKPVHTLDLVVLAVEEGSGRRRGWLSNIHLGARHADGSFVMVGKTFKGMTDAMLEWQTQRFGELATERRGHVVHVRPEQVVEIALDGAQRSTRYPGGVALRFARVVRYRDDKPATEADSIETVRALL